MENDFSLFEMRMIQGMISKYPVADIADLVEKPVQEVEDYIKLFIEGKGILSFQQRIEEKEKIKNRAKEWKRLQNKKAKAEENDLLARKKELKRIRHAREQEVIKKRKRVEPVLKTRGQDYSKMISIRIDRKTIIFAKPGEDPELVKKRYLQNLKSSAPVAPVSRDVVVKKFKPIK